MIRTIKTKQFKITAFVLALVLTVSCIAWNTTKVHAQELEITGANTTGFTVFGSSRAITDDNKLVGTSDTYATMSVFITGGSETKYNATNMKCEHNGTGWTSEETVLFAGTNSVQQIYACSPFSADAVNGVIPVDAADQTDWLVATKTALTSNSVNLTMTHALTKLVLNPTFGSEVINTTIANVEIGGMYASGDLSIANNTWSNLSEANATLTMRNNEALIIPIKCASFTVTITMADGKVFTTTVNCPEGGLAAGTQYNINLQVGQDTVTLGGITAEPWGTPIDGGKLETE